MRRTGRGPTHQARGRRGARGVHGQTHRRARQKRARLRYPQADLRTLDMPDELGISREPVASLADCSWVERHRNIVAQGYCEFGKSWIICALARQACHNRYRARYIRIPDLEEEWRQTADKPQGRSRLLKRYSAYTVLALDEWLFDPPEERFRAFLFELMERRHDTGSTLFATQYPQKDWHQRLGGGTHADAIMDRIVHNTTWIETGDYNMREHAPGR